MSKDLKIISDVNSPKKKRLVKKIISDETEEITEIKEEKAETNKDEKEENEKGNGVSVEEEKKNENNNNNFPSNIEEKDEKINSVETEKNISLEKNNDNNNIVIEEDENKIDSNKKLIQKKRRPRKRFDEEYLINERYQRRKKKEIIETNQEDSDIISIHEEEEKIMNSSYEPKVDNKVLSTPFGKLLQISQEYGFNTVMDRIIGFINQNESATKYGMGISKDIKDILKKLNKETINLYFIKLLAYNQKKNFKILNDFKMSNDRQFAKYMKKRKEGRIRLDYNNDGNENKISSDESDLTEDKEKINTDEYEDEEDSMRYEKKARNKLKNGDDEDADAEDDENIVDEKVDRRRGTDLHDNIQYRSRHFQWKDGILHSYVPKINFQSTRFYLYCWKMGCKGKVRIDMINQTAKEYGEHTNHRGVILENFKDEYPDLAAKDWEHIQYDVKNGEKILMWKY